MAKRRVTLELDMGPTDARTVCLRALDDLGWDVIDEAGDPVCAHEDFSRLHCHCPPATAEITLGSGEAGTNLDLEVRVPAWGIVSSHQARDRLELLARRIAATASQRESSEASGASDGARR